MLFNTFIAYYSGTSLNKCLSVLSQEDATLFVEVFVVIQVIMRYGEVSYQADVTGVSFLKSK